MKQLHIIVLSFMLTIGVIVFMITPHPSHPSCNANEHEICLTNNCAKVSLFDRETYSCECMSNECNIDSLHHYSCTNGTEGMI